MAESDGKGSDSVEHDAVDADAVHDRGATDPASGRDSDTFPRQHARTQRLTLGEPRTLTVAPDGRRVVFLRSRGGNDTVTCLWVLDVDTGEERLVADPRVLLSSGDENDLPAAERARRERARESAGGVVTYATDPDVRVVTFPLGGRLFVGGLISAQVRELAVDGPVFDPRPDPTASRLAYVRGDDLVIAELDGSTRVIAGPDRDESGVSWGSADFIAAEEMDRQRGYWWAPDGTALAVARVDTSGVDRWWIGDPANPSREPAAIAYPAAGTTNADVRLFVVRLDGSQTEVAWDRIALPYLARASWTTGGGLTIAVQSRDQRRLEVLAVDSVTGATRPVFVDMDDAWVELVAGSPTWLPDGRLVVAADRDGCRRLLVGGVAVTPDVLHVRAIVAADESGVVFTANDVDAPAEVHVWRWSAADGLVQMLSDGPGVHAASWGGGTLALRSATMADPGVRTSVRPKSGGDPIVVTSHAERPLVTPNVRFLRLGERRLPAALLLPSGMAHASDPSPDDGDPVRLPVLLDPYGGPHAQRVVRSYNAHLTSQWFADQGFAVLVIDGRGTPGPGSAWERAVHGDLAEPVLQDQVDGLLAAAEVDPRLDLTRVAIRGWSFGGYLAALAVLRRPDVFHAAVAGAPVTEWRLYDTHYTERYLGADPQADPEPYERSSLLNDAAALERPLLLVHGLADDNVVAAHTLQLSSALLAAGRPHEVLPLSGVTHMTPQEVVAENLLRLQLAFIRRALAITG